MPSTILRFKYDQWEEVDKAYLELFEMTHLLHQAMFQHRRTNEQAVQLDNLLFIW